MAPHQCYKCPQTLPTTKETQHLRSTKQRPIQEPHATPLPQLCDIFIRTYDTNDTLYMDQTGKFPHLSSQGNRYQMILYHVNSNSIWVKPTKNKTEGKLILACKSALLRMKACRNTPSRQVMDNEISAAYKTAITKLGMLYQLVPLDDHQENIAEKAIQTRRITSLPSLVAITTNFLSTSGANSFHKWSANSVSFINPMHIHTSLHMLIFTDIMTTTPILLCP
ncbi:hypothetical protein ACHAW6_010431 [Cyclotella cf. meneghiniana]